MLQWPEQVGMAGNAAGEGRDTTTPAINGLIHTLREARRGQRITQLDLAARLGVTEITVVEWETRRDIPATGNFFRWVDELGYVVEVRESSGESLKAPGRVPRMRGVEARMTRTQRLLKHARIASGLTQEGLGTELGVSTWSVRMWESAQRTPRLVHLVHWCGVLGCQLELAKA